MVVAIGSPLLKEKLSIDEYLTATVLNEVPCIAHFKRFIYVICFQHELRDLKTDDKPG